MNDDLEKAATDLYDATNAFRAKWNAAFGEKASDGEEFAAFDKNAGENIPTINTNKIKIK